MKTEMEELMEQIDEATGPMLAMAQRLYQKMGNNPDMWKDLAKCYKVAVDAFIAEGFSREEAVIMTTASLNSLGFKK